MRLSTLRNDRGSAFVELALVVPLLALVLIGSAELGRMAYFAIEVSDAARAGVAYGAQSPSTAPDIPNIKIAAAAAAPDLPSPLAVTPTQPCVCEHVNSSTGTVTSNTIVVPGGICGGSSLPAAQCPPSTIPGTTNIIVNYVQVSTSATVSTMFNYPGIPNSFKLTGFAKMRVLEN